MCRPSLETTTTPITRITMGIGCSVAGCWDPCEGTPPNLKPMTTTDAKKRPSLAWLWSDAAWQPVALPLVLAAVQIGGTYFASRSQTDREPLDALAVGLLAAGPAALIARHRYPVAVLWAVAGVTLAYMLLGYAYGPVFLSVIVGLFVAVGDGHRLAAWLVAAALYSGHFGLRFLFDIDSQPTLGQLVFVAAWLLVVLAASEVARARHESAIEAERTREQEARRRASEERLRIARELHDVLAHHISLMNVQAGVALHLIDRQPGQAITALTAIERASREALSELRSVLRILQQQEEGAPRSPVPGLARLNGLVEQTQAAGLDVRTQIEGVPRPLPSSVDAAAFRILQEALTNVLRHASARSTTVRVRYGEHEVEIQVDDDGSGTSQPSSREGGSGISGMRERVTVLGGQFEAGPLPDHGFRVSARLPLGGVP
jgi:signal transduction histidine kinase